MKNPLPIILILIILTLQLPTQTTGQTDVKLSLYVAPDKLPADGESYKSLMIQVEDNTGPTPAPRDIQVILSSSNEKVGRVASQLIIAQGDTYIITEIQTTETPGQTTITAVSTGIPTASTTITTVTPTGTPTKLGVYPSPPSIPADATLTSRVTIRLEDSRGLPARAPSDVEVTLTLSNTKIGALKTGRVTIPAGEAEVTTTFQATYTPGSTTITASTRDYTPASATMTTVGTTATRVAVYALPSNYYVQDKTGLLIVQLQDDSGNLAKAPADTMVVLTSDNSTRAYPAGSVTIRKGNSQASGSFIISNAGAVTITAVAQGYASSSTTVNIYSDSGNVASVALTVAGGKIPSDGSSYTVIAAQLLTSGSRPVTLPYLVTVALSSSNTAVGSVDNIKIEGGRSYGLTTIKTTYTAGDTTLTATTPGYSAATATLTTVGSSPTKINLALAPTNLYADGATYKSLIVQLNDPSGNPIKATSSVNVLLHSSNLDVGGVDPSVTIHAGHDHALANFYSTNIAGSTTTTAIAEGYTEGTTTVSPQTPEPHTFALFALPSQVNADGTSYDSIYIQPRDSSGSPAIPWSNVTLHLTSSDLLVGDVDPVVTIPSGQALLITQFHSGTVAGETTIDAVSSGLGTATLEVSTAYWQTSQQTFYTITTKTTPATITVGESATLDVGVSTGGEPLPNAQIRLQTNLGSLAATSLTTGADGHASTTYSSDQPGEATITLIVIKQGYPAQSKTVTLTIQPSTFNTTTIIIIAAVGGAAGALLFLLYRTGRLKGLPKLKIREILPKPKSTKLLPTPQSLC